MTMTMAGAMMTMRCQLERDSLAGHSDEKRFTALGSAVACRLWSIAGREAVGEDKTTVVEDLRAIVPLGTDVTVLDQIHGITDRAGNSIDSRVLEVQSLLSKKDHIELILEVRSD
jgi:hypothetical protein